MTHFLLNKQNGSLSIASPVRAEFVIIDRIHSFASPNRRFTEERQSFQLRECLVRANSIDCRHGLAGLASILNPMASH